MWIKEEAVRSESGSSTGAGFVRREMGGNIGGGGWGGVYGSERGSRADLMGERADVGCPQRSGATLYLALQTDREGPAKKPASLVLEA